MAAISSELVLSRVLSVVTGRHETSQQLDIEYAAAEAPRLQVAEIVSLAVVVYGIGLPADDPTMAAVLDKYGRPAPDHGRAVVLQCADGRLGLSAGAAGAVESVGDHMSLIVTPAEGRYVKAWLLPQIVYFGGK